MLEARALKAARAELRGERTGILGAAWMIVTVAFEAAAVRAEGLVVE